ncbi:zinc finger protein [Trichonephila inaurata madagascariensis]|uniref:Zinc finger protein n=1 Tax=Trichonephila inaurata madagascariensis TaxID=2747483 RepID=A0A8X6WQF0_9ARAC|nr:zinc finger protein [Trichonephila inaurata madagascariensis]
MRPPNPKANSIESKRACSFNQNQSSMTEYGQMHGHYPQTNVNLPSASFVMRPKIDIIPQFNRDDCALFFEYNPLQIKGCKMNQHFSRSQIPMPLGYRQKEFDPYELYRQCKTNLLRMSLECREIDLSTHLMNQHVNANPNDVTDAHGDIPLPERSSSPQHRIFNKMDLNLQQNSIESRRNLYSVNRSNIIYGEPNTTENVEKRSAIFSIVTQNEIVENDKSFASNSSLKNSNAHSLETSKRHKRYGMLIFPQTNVNLPSASFVMRPKIDIIPQFNRDDCALFFEYNPLQFKGCKMNQHFNTSQIPMPLGYRQKEFDPYELYRQCKTNLLSMSHECREIDLSTHLMNQQVNANPQDVTDGGEFPFRREVHPRNIEYLIKWT